MRRAVKLLADGVAAAMFAAVFVIFCMKIVMRYVGHNELAWTDEVAILLFIWIVFWANSFMLSDRDHIRFDLVLHVVPPGARRAMAIARALLIGGIFLAALPGTFDYILFLWRERTPVLRLRLDIAYFCFGVFVATVPLRAAWGAIQAIGPDWRRHV